MDFGNEQDVNPLCSLGDLLFKATFPSPQSCAFFALFVANLPPCPPRASPDFLLSAFTISKKR